MGMEYERNLRGKKLARQVLHLNGHQNHPKFILFQPVWFFMILSFAMSGVISILSWVALLGLLGFLFELCLWGWYYATTRRVMAYPGLTAWFNIRVRRQLMQYGRSAGILSQPR